MMQPAGHGPGHAAHLSVEVRRILKLNMTARCRSAKFSLDYRTALQCGKKKKCLSMAFDLATELPQSLQHGWSDEQEAAMCKQGSYTPPISQDEGRCACHNHDTSAACVSCLC